MSASPAEVDPARTLSTWVLRTRSGPGLRRLAQLAGDGRPEPGDQGAYAAEYARVLALHSTAPDPARAKDLFDTLSPDQLAPDVAFVRAQLLLAEHEDARVADLVAGGRLTTAARFTLRADLAHPWRHSATPDDAQITTWLAVINEPFVAAGLEAVTLAEPFDVAAPTPPSVFTRLRSHATQGVDGDLVTVVVSTFRPDLDLLMSVRSLADQSWSNLEILLIDDDSGPGYDHWLARAEALDTRVRILRAPTNAGTYAARNVGIERAKGRFITFHDFDDWAHPRRVERQVAALTSPTRRGSVLASRSGCIRAFADLTLSYTGYLPQRLNASSLLYDLAPVTAAIGGFDPVRKSADMEFPLRLVAARPGSLHDLRVSAPLAITQLRRGSLSRADAVPGWTHWSRIAYRDTYREWHSRIALGQTSPWLPTASSGPSVAGPASPTLTFRSTPERVPDCLPVAARRRSDRVDVVVLANLRSPQAWLRHMALELRSWAHSGLDIRIAHLDHPAGSAVRLAELNPSMGRLLNDRVVAWADPDARLSIGTLLCHDPAIVRWRDASWHSWQVQSTIVAARLAREVTPGSDSVEESLQPADVLSLVRSVFGAPARWRALTPEARDALAARGVTTPHVPLAVAPDLLRRYHDPSPVRARVGHGILDDSAWHVTRADLRAAWPDSRHIDVRFVAGRALAERIVGDPGLDPRWLFLDAAGGPHDPWANAAFDVVSTPGRLTSLAVDALREAACAGAAVMLPEALRSVLATYDEDLARVTLFGDHCRRSDSVQRWWADQPARRVHSEHARTVLTQAFHRRTAAVVTPVLQGA